MLLVRHRCRCHCLWIGCITYYNNINTEFCVMGVWKALQVFELAALSLTKWHFFFLLSQLSHFFFSVFRTHFVLDFVVVFVVSLVCFILSFSFHAWLWGISLSLGIVCNTLLTAHVITMDELENQANIVSSGTKKRNGNCEKKEIVHII